MMKKDKEPTGDGSKFGPLDLADLWKVVAGEDAEFIVKKNEVGSDLAALVAYVEETRSGLADRLSWKDSRVTKVLSGTENLTLKTVFELARALGYDFQIVLKAIGQHRIPQPWEHQACVYEIRNHLSEAKAMLETAKAINRQSFRFPRVTHNFFQVSTRIAANEKKDAALSTTA